MIIADENIDFRIIQELRKNGIEVFSIAEEFRGIGDFEIIELAKKNRPDNLNRRQRFWRVGFCT